MSAILLSILVANLISVEYEQVIDWSQDRCVTIGYTSEEFEGTISRIALYHETKMPTAGYKERKRFLQKQGEKLFSDCY